MRNPSCFPMCAVKLRSSLHPQFQCWCPLNFKSSSKFPRPGATLSKTAPSWIYPYISQLIGSVLSFRALESIFLIDLGRPSWACPTNHPPHYHQGYWSFFQSFFTGLSGGRSAFDFVPCPTYLLEDLYIPVSEPGGICHSHSKGLPTSSSTIYSWRPFN